MPIVFCSRKLAKLIDLDQRLPSISLDNWNAHLFILERRKCIALVQKETLYSVVLFGVLKAQLKDFKNLFLNHLLQQLEYDSLLTPNIKNAIITQFDTFNLSSTDDDRPTIGFLNDCIRRLTWSNYGEIPTILAAQNYVRSEYYNDTPIYSGKSNPKELMAEKLKNFA
jgi:hypothetical protein